MPRGVPLLLGQNSENQKFKNAGCTVTRRAAAAGAQGRCYERIEQSLVAQPVLTRTDRYEQVPTAGRIRTTRRWHSRWELPSFRRCGVNAAFGLGRRGRYSIKTRRSRFGGTVRDRRGTLFGTKWYYSDSRRTRSTFHRPSAVISLAPPDVTFAKPAS